MAGVSPARQASTARGLKALLRDGRCQSLLRGIDFDLDWKA